MNCKPGDLAIIVSSKSQYNGRIVEVLFAPPAAAFDLPDGYPACADSGTDSWVVKFIGGPAPAPLLNGRIRQAWYAVGADKCLKPLRGDPDEVTHEEETTV